MRRFGDPLVRQVIVVDNASSDGSPEMVATEFPEVLLIRSKQNVGFACANNIGLQYVASPFVAMVNSDVNIHKECFERLSQVLVEQSQVGLVGPKALGPDGKLQRTCRRLPTLWNTFCRAFALDNVFSRWPLFSGREMRHWSQDTRREVETLSGCFWLARTEVAKEIGGLDERFFFYAEDTDWCRRFLDAGCKIVFVPEATITHFGGASSNKAPLRYSIEMLRANLAYWKKYYGAPGHAAFYLLSILHHALRLVVRTSKRLGAPRSNAEGAYKLKRSAMCLRWLLTGKEI
jgi:GT2 family glycosyltransferase